jgi:hypothetical protein
MSDIEIVVTKELIEFPEELCKCGKESDYGCHGFRDQQMYNEFYCRECYNKRNQHGTARTGETNETA